MSIYYPEGLHCWLPEVVLIHAQVVDNQTCQNIIPFVCVWYQQPEVALIHAQVDGYQPCQSIILNYY